MPALKPDRSLSCSVRRLCKSPSRTKQRARPARRRIFRNKAAGDLWLVKLQETRRQAYVEEQKQIKERGFLAVMWPKLVVFLVLLVLWVLFLQWYF